VRHAYNVQVAGSIPAARRTTLHPCRISSTGQSTCLVNRVSGFESCIRLHSENIWKAVRLVPRPVSKTGPGENPEGSNPLPSSKQSRLRSSMERAASFYLASCGFESRRRLAVTPPLCCRCRQVAFFVVELGARCRIVLQPSVGISRRGPGVTWPPLWPSVNLAPMPA
jgi:hypothetical protein